jgi:hypothetical protein
MREIRPYGSVRGVRSNPYPYRDIPPSAAKQRQTLIPTPATHLRTRLGKAVRGFESLPRRQKSSFPTNTG